MSARNDSNFILAWVLLWVPAVVMIFVLSLPYFTQFGRVDITGACVLLYVYAIFGPALYRVFKR